MTGNYLFDRLFRPKHAAGLAVEAGHRSLTHGALEAETARWAAALAGLGLRPGDRLVARVEKSLSNLALYLATVRAGGVYVPLNPAYTDAELAYFLADAEPSVVVCDPCTQGAVQPLAPAAQVVGLDRRGEGSLAALAAAAVGDRQTPKPRGPDDLAAICYTSGTTGRSKGAMLTHANLASNATTLAHLWRFTDEDVLIHALPLFHVHGLFVAAHVMLLCGGTIILQPRFDPKAVLAAMPRATALMGVPTFFTRLLAEPGLTREACAGMRLFVSGSAPLLAATHQAWRERTGHAILERYGMTEVGMIASNPYDGERRAGTVGFPVPGVSVRIVGQKGEPVAAGAVGMIEVRGPNVGPGYWRDPVKTAEARRDGWFVTGDLGQVDAEGYLAIVGRGRDLIITGGLNVYPREVEAAIDALPGVIESAVVGLPHDDFGEAVTAVVVGEGLDEAAVIAALYDRLARFKRPKRVLFLGALPRNAMGKVQKAALRKRLAGLYGAG